MKFLISTATGLGNSIMLTPLLKTIHLSFSDAIIDILGGSPYGSDEIIGGLPYVRKIIKIGNNSWANVLIQIRAFEKYDCFLCPFSACNLRAALAVRFFHRAKKTIGAFSPVDSWKVKLLSKAALTDIIKINSLKHESWNNLVILKSLGISENRWSNHPEIPEGVKPKTFLPDRYIVLHIATTNGMKSPKQWFPERWQELCKMILENTVFDVVLVGDKFEKDMGKDMGEHLTEGIKSKDRITDLIGLTDIPELIWVLKKSSVVIGADSGVVHISSVLNIPTIVLWGPTGITKSHPLGEKLSIIHKAFPCSPCSGGNLKKDEDAYNDCPERPCMEAISVKDVFGTLVKKMEL